MNYTKYKRELDGAKTFYDYFHSVQVWRRRTEEGLLKRGDVSQIREHQKTLLKLQPEEIYQGIRKSFPDVTCLDEIVRISSAHDCTDNNCDSNYTRVAALMSGKIAANLWREGNEDDLAIKKLVRYHKDIRQILEYKQQQDIPMGLLFLEGVLGLPLVKHPRLTRR